MKTVIFKIIIFLSIINTSQRVIAQETAYLFSYFKGNGDGLHLAYSWDGLNWEALNNDSTYIKPILGKDKLMRDPSIVQDDQGIFYMVWTTGWWDQGIGYSSSVDLKNWSDQRYIPVMENFSGTKNTWAPEIFYDKATKIFYIFWASTIEGLYPKVVTTPNEEGLNHRQYFITTKDFETFSKTKLFFDGGFSVIDGAIIKKNDTYYLFVKNETSVPTEKNIWITSNDKPYDFPTKVSGPITENWVEGPTPLLVNEYVYVYFDKYRNKKYGAIRSKDMQHWEDISNKISFPKGARHGTAFPVSLQVLNNLLK